MNAGIRDNSRGTKGNQNNEYLSKIAKSMGLDMSKHGKEAQNMWSMLNEMAASDPKSYDSFIQKQMENGIPKKSLTPKPGYVLKGHLFKENVKIFLNLCSSKVLEMPKDGNGNVLSENSNTLDNLDIPMVIGPIRKLNDPVSNTDYCAVDVIFHPWIIKKTEGSCRFKTNINSLARDSVQQEKQVKFKDPLKLIKSVYKGGNGVGKDATAVPYVIPMDATEKSQQAPVEAPANDDNLEEVLKSPMSLLRKMEAPNKGIADIELKTETKKKVLIEEVNTNETNKQKPKKKAIKGGFLNNTKSCLYPKGSSEGRTESSYSKLMSRSQVVDLSDTPANMKVPAPPVRKEPIADPEQDFGDKEFNDLCEDLEPDLQNKKTPSAEEYAFNQQFEMLSNALNK